MILQTLIIFILCITAQATPNFHPQDYTKQHVQCPTVNRNGGTGEPRETTINMSYVNINPNANKTTLLMVHGFPGLWSSFSNQILHFQDKYNLVIPDLRGFGDSTHPGDVQASGSYGDFVGDLVCVLRHAGVAKAVCIGHDWGAQICYEAARMRPDLIEGVVGAALPYLPAVAKEPIPIESLIAALPKLTYLIYLQKKTDAAIAELNRDIRRSLRAFIRSYHSPSAHRFLRSKHNLLKAYDDVDEIPPIPFFTPEEEDYYVEQYQKQGFDY
ncbi:hypothetical protein FRC17_008590, partial [Serendipita sp. 399]